jgi:AraC family transcriptional regulator of arabinose operon
MDNRIRSTIATIQQRFDRPLPVAALAAAVHLSPSRFSHLFPRDVGLSPGQYIKAVRMAAAQRLLEGSFLTVKEVMAQVGFSDPSHFVRDFKQHHGIRPGEARRRRADGAASGLPDGTTAPATNPGNGDPTAPQQEPPTNSTIG